MNRRHFAQGIALLAGGVALPAIAGVSSALDLIGEAAPKDLCRNFFEARVGKIFQLCGSGSRTMLLKRVENACGEDAPEQFLAYFEASPGERLQEGIYQLERPFTGRHDIFLTESNQGKSRQQMVSIINLQNTVC